MKWNKQEGMHLQATGDEVRGGTNTGQTWNRVSGAQCEVFQSLRLTFE